jgi:iron complex outermembrane recepter protein
MGVGRGRIRKLDRNTWRHRTLAAITASAAAFAGAASSSAQTAPEGDAGKTLPPVVVESPQQRKEAAPTKPQPVRHATASRVKRGRPAASAANAANAASSNAAGGGGTQGGAGSIHGFVASQNTSATKTNTPILEIPQSVSVITPGQMKAQGATDLTEAIRYTSGVTGAINATDTRWDAPLVRGYTAPLYLDGMLLPIGSNLYARPRMETYALQEIDILKGSGVGPLYGQSSPGGIIDMISLRPTAAPVHNVEILGNTYGNIQGAFDVGGAIDKEAHFLYRLTGVAHDGGTQIYDVNDLHEFIAPAFTWQPTGATTWTFLSNFTHDRTGTPIQFLPAAGTLYSNPNGRLSLSTNVGEPGHDFFERDQAMAGYLFEHHVDEIFTLRQNVRYATLNTNTQSVIGSGLQMGSFTELNRANYSLPEDATAFNVDNQAEAKFAMGPLLQTVLLGLDYRHTTDAFTFGNVAVAPINMYDPVYGATLPTPKVLQNTVQRQDQTGLYAQDQMKLGGWGLTLSGRHDQVDTTTNNLLSGVGTGNTTLDTDALSGRAALNYVFDFGLAPYIAAARSFNPNAGVSFAGTPFQPSFGTDYEVGVKYQPRGLNMLVTLAAYTMNQTNVLVADVAPGHTGFNTTIGAEGIKGFEFEDKWSVTERFNLIASYTYNDARITAGNPSTPTVPTTVGNRAPSVPLNQAALWSDYTLHEGVLACFGFGGGVRYIGNSYGDAANTLYIPSYTLFDAAFHYDLVNLYPALKGAVLQVNILNLFNTYYVSSCQSLSQCYLGNGRVAKISMRYSW